MTPEQLAEIEARAAAATPGEWEVSNDSAGDGVKSQNGMVCEIVTGDLFQIALDMEFIAAARQDIPRLCAEVRRLQNGIAKIEARWREASENKTFRTHYRETMAECAHKLRDLLAGSVDEDELEAEINKTIDEDEPLTRDQMPWFRANMR